MDSNEPETPASTCSNVTPTAGKISAAKAEQDNDAQPETSALIDLA